MKKTFIIINIVVCLLILCGCTADEPEPVEEPVMTVNLSAGEFPSDITELTAVLQPDETALLSGFTCLESADFSGSSCYEEIFLWASQHPQTDVLYTVDLPGGQELPCWSKTADLSGLVHSQVSQAIDAFACLPKLRSIDLGVESSGADALTWEDISAIQAAVPMAKISYVFTLYGQSYDLSDKLMDLNHIPIDDGGELVRRITACMPELRTLDMDSCGVSDADMELIRNQLPYTDVIWRIWFGSSYSVRTDVTKILASKPSLGGELTDENAACLKYCTKLRYLDIGHNENLADFSFLSHMPELEVAILAMNSCTDYSALANCPKLEYLELFSSPAGDISFLSGKKELRHLNIQYMPNLTDISPLFELTGLERLWIGLTTPVLPDQVETLRTLVPGCEIDLVDSNSWKYQSYSEIIWDFILQPRYKLLREQFGYAESAYSFSWLDPKY